MIDDGEHVKNWGEEKKGIDLASLLPEVLRTLNEGVVPDGLSHETTKFLEEILSAHLEMVEQQAKEMAKKGKKTARKALLGENMNDGDNNKNHPERKIEEIKL